VGILARREIPAAKVPWGLAAIPDRPVHRGFRGLLAQEGIRGLRALRVFRGLKDLRARRVYPDRLVQSGRKALPVCPDLRAPKGLKAARVPKARRVYRAI
jgi:hypothetical protein